MFRFPCPRLSLSPSEFYYPVQLFFFRFVSFRFPFSAVHLFYFRLLRARRLGRSPGVRGTATFFGGGGTALCSVATPVMLPSSKGRLFRWTMNGAAPLSGGIARDRIFFFSFSFSFFSFFSRLDANDGRVRSSPIARTLDVQV